VVQNPPFLGYTSRPYGWLVEGQASHPALDLVRFVRCSIRTEAMMTLGVAITRYDLLSAALRRCGAAAGGRAV